MELKESYCKSLRASVFSAVPRRSLGEDWWLTNSPLKQLK